MIRKIIIFFIFFSIGVIHILAPRYGWEYPGIYWFLRETKYGEVFNKIICTVLGIIIIAESLIFLLTD